MTAPTENPPRLYSPRRANRVFPLDLPGHGADANGDTAAVLLDECVHSISRSVERSGLKDLVLVGHGFAASLVMQAAEQMAQAPKRIVLIAGIIPNDRKNMLSVFPNATRKAFKLMAVVSKASGRDVKIPSQAIGHYLCNGMDSIEVVRSLGYFGPLPTRVLATKVSPSELTLRCPVTYVVLTDDRLLPANTQRQMATRIPDAEVVELQSCHEAMLYKPRELADILLSFA